METSLYCKLCLWRRCWCEVFPDNKLMFIVQRFVNTSHYRPSLLGFLHFEVWLIGFCPFVSVTHYNTAHKLIFLCRTTEALRNNAIISTIVQNEILNTTLENINRVLLEGLTIPRVSLSRNELEVSANYCPKMLPEWYMSSWKWSPQSTKLKISVKRIAMEKEIWKAV